jgi:hypothetical protein
MMMPTKIMVIGYAGYRAEERPLSVSLGKKKLRVMAILDQWYGPDYTYFKVLAEDANTYIVRYQRTDDEWELVYFKAGDYADEKASPAGGDATS